MIAYVVACEVVTPALFMLPALMFLSVVILVIRMVFVILRTPHHATHTFDRRFYEDADLGPF